MPTDNTLSILTWNPLCEWEKSVSVSTEFHLWHLKTEVIVQIGFKMAKKNFDVNKLRLNV